MADYKSSLLWEHLVLLSRESLHQLLPHDQKHRAEEALSKDESGIMFGETLTKHWHMAETHPPVVQIVFMYFF